MSDAPTTTPAVAAPVEETPAVAETTSAVTETPAVAEPAVAAAEAPVEEAAKAEEPVEAAAEEAKPVEPKYDGHLNYNAPTSFLREFLPLPPKKVYFWFGKEPIETKELSHYLAKGKEAAHSTAAWAAETGEGLLLFSKTGEKSAPTGVLNLADAEDIKEAGTNEFSFKLGGHKHKFDAPNGGERDSWLAAVKKIAEEAKAKKEEILASDSYKATIAKFSPVVAAAGIAKASEETPKKSTEVPEETPAETLDTSKTSKSRSRSRGAPANIIGFFKGKKGEKSEEAKKEEEPVPATEEVAAETVAPTEPVEEAAVAPVTDAVPAVEEKKDEAKPNRRLSRFETFFNKKGEKKEETAPTTEAAVAEPAAVEAATETPVITEPAAETAAPAEEEAKATTPTKERKPSFLAGIQKLTQKVRSPSSEHPPAVESSTVEETPASTEAVTDAAEPTEAAAVADADKDVPTSPTEKAEKRRSSLFNFNSLKKLGEKQAKAAEPAATTEEPATTEDAKVVEEAAPAVSAAEEPAKTSTEEKAAEKAPKEHKESPITQLGRRFSKAIRGGAKREPKTPAKVAEDEATKVEPVSAEAPQLDEPTEAPAAIGDVVPEAVTVSAAPPASTTVSATA